ncbi:MAG: hypothetical protein ABFR02_07930 [Campylobacterota bacterium]
MLDYRMRYIILLAILFFISACSYSSSLEIAQHDKKRHIIAVIPFQNSSAYLTRKIRESLTKESRLYVVSPEEIKGSLKADNFSVTDEKTAIETGKRLKAQTVLFGTFKSPVHQMQEYQHTKTKCRQEQCWQIKVTCRSHATSISTQVKMVELATMSTLLHSHISKETRWDECADETVKEQSVRSHLDAFSKKIADEITRELLKAL